MYSIKDLAGKVSHHCSALSITAVDKVLRKKSQALEEFQTHYTACIYIYIYTQRYFVMEKSDILVWVLYVLAVWVHDIWQGSIYVKYLLTFLCWDLQSALCSLPFSNIYLKPPRSIRKFSLFRKQLAKGNIFSLFPNVELFVAFYSSPRSPLDSFCPRSKAFVYDGSLKMNTFHSWRIRNMRR